MLRAFASLLFGVFVATIVVALKAEPSASERLLSPTSVVAIFGCLFMCVLLEILKPSK